MLAAMATWDDVRRVALALPQTGERGGGDYVEWRVKDKLFAWMRPLRKTDLQALGANAPDGPILAVRTDGLSAKEALLADDPIVYFTTPHFDGWPAILVQLDHIDVDELEELITEGWAVQAPKRVSTEFFARRDG
jgi:hypothetical protein